MAAISYWFRLDLRRRWRSLLVLTVLIALAAGTVMTAVAGARRGGSAMDRLLAETSPATVLVAPMTPEFDWEPVRALAEVEALTTVVFAGFEIDGEPAPDSFMLPPADTEAMSTIERPVVLDGRLADPSRADEVVVTPAFADRYGASVGDTVELGLYTPEQADTGQGPDRARTNLVDLWILTNQQQVAAGESGVDQNETAPAAGPVVEATIVGIVRSPWFGDRLDTAGFVVPSAGLYAEYAPNLLGAERLASINALVRLDGGEAAIPGFLAGLAEVTGRPDIDVHNLAALAREIEDANSFEAQSLFFLALAAGIAAAFLVGLSITRYAASTVTDLRVLRDLGMTPGQSRRAAAAGPTVAAVAGTVLGATAAVIASRWFPIGSASLVEPAPGADADTAVLVVGLLVVPMLVAVGAGAAAALALRSSGEASTSPRSAVVTSAGRLPVPEIMGMRFALEPGRGRTAVPVRPALLGAVAGVSGVLAAFTFSSAVQDAAANPVRFGVVHQVEAWVGFDNVSLAPADTIFAALADVPGVAGVNGIRGQVATAGGEQVTVLSFSPVGRQLDYVVTEGRLPAGPAETLLSRVAADAFEAETGDTVTVTGTTGEAELAVVGIGVIDPAIGPAAATTPAAYDGLFDGEFMFHYAEIGLEHDVEAEAILPRLSEAVPDEEFGLFPYARESPPGLRFMRPLPVLLAGFLVLLALGAVGHAVATALQRRRGDVAVLRALGMTPGQSRRVVITQATVLALPGLGVGIPLGVALGRTAWRYVADTLYIHYVPPVAWLALVLVVPLSLLAVNLLAAWPGHRAASMRVGDVLRAE